MSVDPFKVRVRRTPRTSLTNLDEHGPVYLQCVSARVVAGRRGCFLYHSYPLQLKGGVRYFVPRGAHARALQLLFEEGLTGREAAKRLKVSRGAIRRWEERLLVRLGARSRRTTNEYDTMIAEDSSRILWFPRPELGGRSGRERATPPSLPSSASIGPSSAGP